MAANTPPALVLEALATVANLIAERCVPSADAAQISQGISDLVRTATVLRTVRTSGQLNTADDSDQRHVAHS
jgi:hypothetical protein